MEEILKINGSDSLTGNHKVLTDRGLLEAKDLKIGDNIQTIYGQSEIVNVIECEKRPDAPILDETIPYESFRMFEEDIANKITECGKSVLKTTIPLLDEITSGGLPVGHIGKVCGGNYGIWDLTNSRYGALGDNVETTSENFKIFERLIEFGKGYENKEI